MKLEQILKIIRQNNISEQFLGYDEFGKILERINTNIELQQKLEKIPDEYWENVLKLGILVLTDFVYQTNSGKEEDIETRFIDLEQGKRCMPTLAYQKKRKRF